MAQFLQFYSMAEKEISDKRVLKIAERIKKLRIAKGYTSYENFAFDHELPRRSYWRLENGTNFTIEKLLNILDIHKISLEDFFSKDFDKKLSGKPKK
jgi:transcriptional regulator with XRE-family HTH domain